MKDKSSEERGGFSESCSRSGMLLCVPAIQRPAAAQLLPHPPQRDKQSTIQNGNIANGQIQHIKPTDPRDARGVQQTHTKKHLFPCAREVTHTVQLSSLETSAGEPCPSLSVSACQGRNLLFSTTFGD